MSERINIQKTPEIERYVEYTYTNKNGKVITIKRRFDVKTENTASSKEDREAIKTWLLQNIDRIIAISKPHRIKQTMEMLKEDIIKTVCYNTSRNYLKEFIPVEFVKSTSKPKGV